MMLAQRVLREMKKLLGSQNGFHGTPLLRRSCARSDLCPSGRRIQQMSDSIARGERAL